MEQHRGPVVEATSFEYGIQASGNGQTDSEGEERVKFGVLTLSKSFPVVQHN